VKLTDQDESGAYEGFDIRRYSDLTPFEMQARLRFISDRLMKSETAHAAAIDEEAEAQSEYHRAYLTAHLTSLDEHPDRRVDHHKSAAELAAVEERDRLFGAAAKRRSLAAEGHTLRQVLSALQSYCRSVGWTAGESR
jgi:hypothetical protein